MSAKKEVEKTAFFFEAYWAVLTAAKQVNDMQMKCEHAVSSLHGLMRNSGIFPANKQRKPPPTLHTS